MPFLSRRRALTALAVAAGACLLPAAANAQQFINILTGGTSGVYYPLGVALGKIYGEKIPGVKTQVQSTKASVENLNLLQKGRGELALALGDSVKFAWEGNADLGFVAAISSLGVMNMNGQGTPQNFVKGAELLKKARALGSRSARISMVSADFSVLFEAPEFKAVQQKLNDEGFEVGQPDGNFGPQSKKALQAYQQANKLQPNGITLETLDSLGLVDIIPPYDLN